MKKLLQASMLLLMSALASVAGFAADETNPFARDIKILTDWFEGEFDNEEQLWFENDPRSATPDDERHVRVHTIHVRLDLPQFGDHVFYVEEYRDNDPGSLIRQRFVTFEPDLDVGAIRMQQGFFRDPEAFVGAHYDLSKFDGLTAEDVFFMRDLAPDNKCDVFWRRVADQYEGSMEPKGCRLGTNGVGPARYSVHNLILSANKYWRVDSSFLQSDDSLYIGDPVDRPSRMRRASIFHCEGSFRSEAGVQNLNPFRIHSQGGHAKIRRQADGQVFEILLRSKEYPFYETRPDFMYFSIREQGAKRSLLYSVNDADSRRLGLNHNGIAVHCSRTGYDFRQSLDQLP